MWLLCSLHKKIKIGDYKQNKDIKQLPTKRQKRARRRSNLWIDAFAGVDGNVRGDEGTDNKNNDVNWFIVVEDVKYWIIYYLYQFIT